MATKTERAGYGSLTPALADLSNGYKSRISFLKNKLIQAHDLDKESKPCPKCGKTRLLKFFGVRVMRDASTGIPLRAIFQSYCETCRSGKTPGTPAKKKGKAAKKPAEKKVTAKVKSGTAKVVKTVEPPVPAEEPIQGVDAAVVAGMALLAEEGVIHAPAPDEFDTAPSTVDTFATIVGPALDAAGAAPALEEVEEPAPTEEELATFGGVVTAVEQAQERMSVEAAVPAVVAPKLSEGEYETPCGEVMPKGSFCSCPICKAARAS